MEEPNIRQTANPSSSLEIFKVFKINVDDGVILNHIQVVAGPSHLEDTLPDIALASAASFNRQSEPELNVPRSSSTPEIELDLGDGASHS